MQQTKYKFLVRYNFIQDFSWHWVWTLIIRGVTKLEKLLLGYSNLITFKMKSKSEKIC